MFNFLMKSRPILFVVWILALVAFAGCESTKPAQPAVSANAVYQSSPVAASAGVAEWVHNPPRDNAAFLFASAIGPDRDSARRAALLVIAERLSVTVQSEFEQIVEERIGNDPSFSSVARLRSLQTVGKVHFNAHEEVGTQLLRDGTVAVLVQVDRQRMLAETADRIQQLIQSIERGMASSGLQGYPLLQRAGQLRTQGMELRRLFSLHRALGGTPGALSAKLEHAARTDDFFAAAWQQTVVVLQPSGFSAQLAEVMRSQFAAAGVTVLLQTSVISPDMLVINLRGGNRVQPLPAGFSATVQQTVTVRQGNDVFFRGDWQADGTGATRQEAVAVADLRLLNQLLDVDGFSFLGW